MLDDNSPSFNMLFSLRVSLEPKMTVVKRCCCTVVAAKAWKRVIF